MLPLNSRGQPPLATTLSHAAQGHDQQSVTITISLIIISITQYYKISRDNTLQLISNKCNLLGGILGGQPIFLNAISG
jgi:hypothetical protein